MPDIAHQYGSDLTLSATGDLALSDGTQAGRERVLRRLLTAPGAYIWHLAYGAGLPRFVGEVANKLRIAAVARSQMYREAAVARTPAPEINVDVQPTGVVTLGIKYQDAATQATVPLNFNLNG
jgi:hypothetical protein